MNDKEKLFYHVVETAARCCSYTLKDGRQSITVADILGRSRKENVQLTRNIAVSMLIAVGFTVSTCAVMMHRSPPAIRSMVRADRQMQETSMVYRMAARQARTQGMMRDVTLEMDGKETTYTIPENLMVTYAGDLTLATSREALAGDVERKKQEAEKALAEVERHKRTIEKAGELMAELNPEVRKERETERRFKSIESDIGGIKGMITQLLEKLS